MVMKIRGELGIFKVWPNLYQHGYFTVQVISNVSDYLHDVRTDMNNTDRITGIATVIVNLG